MAIKQVEPSAMLRRHKVEELVQFFQTEWKLPPRHVPFFTMSAMMGRWQDQFQELGHPVTSIDGLRGAWRVAQEVAWMYVPIPRYPALRSYDHFHAATVRVLDSFEEWAREILESGVGLLDRVASSRASADEIELAAAWSAARDHFWPKRDVVQLYRAARYALGVLKQPNDPRSCESLLLGLRDTLLDEDAFFRSTTGEFQLGRLNLRDVVSRELKIPRPRPDRVKKSEPKPRLKVRVERVADPCAGVLDLVLTAEFAKYFTEWVEAQRRHVKPTSAKGRVLAFMGSHPGERVPIRPLAREFNLSQGGVSKAAKELARSWREFLQKRSA